MLYPGGINSVTINSVIRKDPYVICTIVQGLQLTTLTAGVFTEAASGVACSCCKSHKSVLLEDT